MLLTVRSRALWSALACCGALLFLLAGCDKPSAAPNGRPGQFGNAANQPVAVVTAAVTRQPLALEIEAVGTATANQSVEITSKAANTVTAIRFEEDQLVRRGAILVEFDSTQIRAELGGAEAALAESEANYKRSRQLESSKVLSQAQLDQIEAALKTSQAAVGVARAKLSDTVIRAPFDGRTGFRNISVGSFVTPGTVVTTLDDTSIVKLDFTVPQTYLSAVKRGVAIGARTNGLPGREFVGNVSALGSRIDPVTRSITVRAELPNKDGLLRPGMFMTVNLSAEDSPVLTVPEAAIVPEQGSTYVFAVVESRVEQRKVTTGRRKPGVVEITSGVEEGDRVIIDGTLKVRDGATVTEAPADPTLTGVTPARVERADRQGEA
jgi:membrane fusion protein, multidrug efflux system